MFNLFKSELLSDNNSNLFYRRIFQLIIISSLTILVFLNTLPNGFVIDDKTFILNAKETRDIKNIPSFFTKPYIGIYRPIKVTFYTLDYQIFKTDPIGYHAQAILINLFSTILVYFIAFYLTKKDSIAFITSLIFGVHPIHTEAISFVASSMDSIGICFFFASFYCYLKYKEKCKKILLSLSVIFAFLAFFTYEATLVLPFLIILFEILTCNKKKILNSFLFLIPAFTFVLIGFVFIGGGRVKESLSLLNGSYFTTILVLILAFFKYLVLYIFPIDLSINPVVAPGIESWVNGFSKTQAIKDLNLLNLHVILGIFVILALISAFVVFFKKNPLVSFCIGWIAISLFPAFYILPKHILAERYAYISSFGAIFLTVIIFNAFYKRKSKYKDIIQNSLITFLVVMVFIFSFLTVKRNMDWKSESTIWSKTAQQETGSDLARYYLGIINMSDQNYKSSIKNFNSVNKKNPDVYYYLSVSYAYNGNYQEAEKTLAKVLKEDPSFSPLKINEVKSIIAQRLGTQNNPVKLSKELKEFRTKGNFSFVYPENLLVNEKENNVFIENKTFIMQLQYFSLEEVSIDEFIASQKEEFGKLLNQGKAMIPFVDFAYVKIWEDKDYKKMEFFLFKNKIVMKVLIYPVTESNMQIFDGIISSLKFN